MILPGYVLDCIHALEQAGYSAYAVGGCVRDACLGLEPHDYDLCTDALPDETEAVFIGHRLILAGKKHGTVAVITSGGVVEITTFRTEGDYQDGRHPGWVSFVPDIREDLARRDFTVNAMAYSPTRGFADPFGGREDLKNHILRAVGRPEERFQEDALRILRGIRFAARYRLTIHPATADAMVHCAPGMDALARERVFQELCKLLPLVTAEDLLRFAPVLCRVIPPLAPMVGYDQRSPHHAYDLYTHTAHVTAAVPGELPLRWAALLHDIGKVSCCTVDDQGRGHFYGHAGISARMADTVLLELKAPTLLRKQVVTLIENHMLPLEPERKALRRQLRRLGWEILPDLIALQQADDSSKGTGPSGGAAHFPRLRELLCQLQSEDSCLTLRDLAVNGRDMMALGCQGKEIGTVLEKLLDQVVEEALPNDRDALLNFARQWKGDRL